jgi:signal transduction histidine kinase/CheY-like chemotaxis protein|tara:strand:+ start:5696 stop:7672 length:1977 start_codon:yes stop_codon:yes gene_type:complete
LARYGEDVAEGGAKVRPSTSTSGHVTTSSGRVSNPAPAQPDRTEPKPERGIAERVRSLNPFGVGHWNVVTDEASSNDQYEQVIGRSFDECRQIGWDHVIHSDDLLRYTTASELLETVGTPLLLTIRFHRPDGEVRWTKVHAKALIGLSGTPIETTMFVVDVTDECRTQAELHVLGEQLDRRNNELESSLDAFHDLRLRLTEDGSYVSVWAGDPAKLTRPAHKLIRTNIAADFPPHITRRFLDAIQAAINTSNVSTVSYFLGVGDTRVHFEARFALVGTREVMVVIRDVSDVRALEEQLVRAHTMESVGRLAGGVAHDFNNVLHIIRGHASALARHLDNPEAAERRLNSIVRAVDRTSSLVDQLMLISRPTPNNPTPTVVDYFLLALRPALQQLLGESTQLQYELNAPSRAVVIDESRFENVILNLSTNARSAIIDGGRVAIRTKLADDATVVIEFSDNGTGMDAETAAQIFDPFFSTKAPGVGTGLGLANAYAAITDASGTIQVDTAPGQGSTFTIELPCVEAEPDSDKSEANFPLDHAGGSTILIVDDDADVVELCAAVLSDVGYSVLEALSGTAALAIIDHGALVDAVLTDVLMPDIGGQELARAVRQRRPGLGVIFMSGYSATCDDAADALKPDRLLRKPFSDADLAHAIRDALA